VNNLIIVDLRIGDSNQRVVFIYLFYFIYNCVLN